MNKVLEGWLTKRLKKLGIKKNLNKLFPKYFSPPSGGIFLPFSDFSFFQKKYRLFSLLWAVFANFYKNTHFLC